MNLHYEVNLLAILVCGIIGMGLGAIWYSPILFGRIWLASLDKSEEELKEDFKPIKAYTISFLSQLVVAFVLARVMSFMGASTPVEGIRVSFMAWIGFTGTTMTVNSLFEGKTFKHFIVDGGYHFIVLMVYGVILGAWLGESI